MTLKSRLPNLETTQFSVFSVRAKQNQTTSSCINITDKFTFNRIVAFKATLFEISHSLQVFLTQNIWRQCYNNVFPSRCGQTVLSIVLSIETVEMQPGVEYDPGNQKARKWSHETFFDQFPRTAVRFLINLLEIYAINVHHTTIDSTETVKCKQFFLLFNSVNRKVKINFSGYLQCKRNKSFHEKRSPNDSKNNPQHLSRPVNNVKKLVLIRPLRFRNQCPGPWW